MVSPIFIPLRKSPSGPPASEDDFLWVPIVFPSLVFDGSHNSNFGAGDNASPPFPIGSTGEGQSQQTSLAYVVGPISQETHVVVYQYTGTSTPIPGAPDFTTTPFCQSFIQIMPGQVMTPQGLATEIRFSIAYLQFLPPGEVYETGPIALDLLFLRKGTLLTQGFPP